LHALSYLESRIIQEGFDSRIVSVALLEIVI
jgi:hypothetical protein